MGVNDSSMIVGHMVRLAIVAGIPTKMFDLAARRIEATSVV